MTELERKVASLRWVCLVETATFILLWMFIFAGNAIGKGLLGSAHGMTFLAFAAMTFGVHKPMGWTRAYLVAVVVLGPIGALMVYERLRRGIPAEALARSKPVPGTFRPESSDASAMPPFAERNGDDAPGVAPTP